MGISLKLPLRYNKFMVEFIIPVFASFAPLFLWPIEQLLPFPEAIEELSIILLVYPLLRVKNASTAYKSALAAGFLFSFTESVLYLSNIAAVGSLETFFLRLGTTTLVHEFSFLIMLFFGRIKKEYILLGFLISLGVHLLYNYFSV